MYQNLLCIRYFAFMSVCLYVDKFIHWFFCAFLIVQEVEVQIVGAAEESHPEVRPQSIINFGIYVKCFILLQEWRMFLQK